MLTIDLTGVWEALSGLRYLQWISFYGLTTFTQEGLLSFVAKLKRPGNEGIVVMVDNADIEDRLSDEEQAEVREAISDKVDGRFEYTLYRGKLSYQILRRSGIETKPCRSRHLRVRG